QTRRAFLKPRDPAILPGNDGQEDEQATRCRDAHRQDTIANMPYGSSTMRKWGNPDHSTSGHAGTRPEVQHALFLVWHAANRICAKRLMPFLPTLVEAAYAA
ncbi:MAG TPA: hypothetical protein VIY29_18830, partial [Ktedonobacteraceae bacterium]